MPDHRLISVMCATLLWTGFAPVGVSAQTAQMLLKEGRYLEETVRDLDAAITTYKSIRQMADDGTNVHPRLVAQSDLAVARCMVRKGKRVEARHCLNTVIREYPQFAGLVTDAQALLQSIPAVDPAVFMPDDTLIYAELTKPWTHAESIIKIMTQADVAKLFASHMQEGRLKFPFDAVFNQFTLNQVAEIRKIESLAVGIVDFPMIRTDNRNNPFTQFIVVLHPGACGLVRTLVANMSQAMLKVDRRFDCDIFEVPGTGGHVHLAMGEEVFLLGAPLPTVVDALARSEAADKNGLAGNQDFQRQAAARRHDSAIITYVNLARLVPIIKTFENRGSFDDLNAVLDLDTVDYLMARVDLDCDRLVFDATVLLNKDRPNAFYEFWKSCPLDRDICRFVPEDAAAAVSITVDNDRRKWDQLFDIAGTVVRANDRPDPSPDAMDFIKELQSILDSDTGRAGLASLQSMAFVLPTLDASTRQGVHGIVDEIVLAGITSDSKAVERTVQRIADRFAQGIQGDPKAKAIREPIVINQVPGTRFRLSEKKHAWTVMMQGDLVLASGSEPGIAKCIEARDWGKSILDLPLDHPLRRFPKNVNKFGFFRTERILQRLGHQDWVQETVADHALPTVFSTLEKPNELSFRMEINNLPKVIRGVADLMLYRFDEALIRVSSDRESATVSVGVHP